MDCGSTEANAKQLSTQDDVSAKEGASQLLVEERQAEIDDSLASYYCYLYLPSDALM